MHGLSTQVIVLVQTLLYCELHPFEQHQWQAMDNYKAILMDTLWTLD